MPPIPAAEWWFTEREMELIAEAFYEHFFDERSDEIDKEIVALGKKVGAIGDGWE